MGCPEECQRRALPAELPVMVLPDCHLYPGCLLPLYIFEDRYRKMLAHALDSNRMFCIGNREGGSEDSPVSRHSTAGLVRACVQQPDGTSHLLLLGLQRIELGEWVQGASDGEAVDGNAGRLGDPRIGRAHDVARLQQ